MWSGANLPIQTILCSLHVAVMAASNRFINEETRHCVRVALFNRGWTQLELARRLGHPVSTLSSWLRAVAPAPVNLLKRIERVLRLAPGVLTTTKRSVS